MSTHQHTANISVPPGPNNARAVQEAFLREIKKRFRKLRGLIRKTVGYENDALNLRANAEPKERFEFDSEQGLTLAFARWLQNAIQEEILEPLSPVDVQEGTHWTSQYIERAYVNGVNQGVGLLFQQGVSIDNIPDAEIPTRPVHRQTLRDLYQRTYQNLKSISEDAVPTVRDVLTTGFSEGVNPKEMARRLTSEIESLERNRAETLARSETINAHSSGALRQYKDAGVETVSHSRWAAADDSRTCPFCDRLDGVEITLDEVENLAINWAVEPDWKPQNWRLKPPAHPNCRCSLRPVIGGSTPTDPLGTRIQEEFGERADVIQ